MINTIPPTYTLHHPRLGLIEVADEDVIHLVAPLPPFMDLRRYVLVPDPEEEPFLWLQSVDQPAVCLVVAPHEDLAGPAPEPGAALRGQLCLRPDEAPEVYVIISLAPDPQQVTMNLLAPLYVCRRTRRARQALREGDVSLARVPLF
ncbi:MAG: flagellar assembly protein FliW [Armatimonadetes bacterium]|nr:flagellar assembly protein FliW [Armatimonadota bacterium]